MASNQPAINVVPPDGYVGEDFVPYKVPELLQDDCLANYFACRYNERDALKATFKQPKQDRVDREITRIATLKTGFEKEDRNRPDINLFKYRQALWKAHAIAACGENLKGVDTKVQAMAPFKQLDVEKKANTLPNPEELEDEETARRIAAERRTAMERRIAMEKKILEAVKKWATPGIPPKPKELEDAEKAEAAAARQEDPLKNLLDKVKKKFWKKESKTKVSRSDREQTADTSRIFDLPEDSYGISVHEITLRKSPNSNPSSYMSYESDTKRHRLSDILSESTESKENPLTMNPEPDTIRYFHFPANNMHWIEEAIARYKGEKTPGEFNYRQDPKYCEKSSDLLCRQFWTSLQHGGVYDPVHARHMRAHCSLITPEMATPSQPISGSKNFVIFMPYLHWETHKRRKKMTEIMKEITNEHHRVRSHVTESLREELTKSAEMILLRHARQLTGFHPLEELEAKKVKPKVEGERSLLGEYLLQTAKVYDAMDIEPDVRILRDHLHKDPPLHARRTLDQSYYWKLQDTDGRDEDQVVYRETKSGKSILRTSRVIMVDQLWLYVLDDHTIISSFPRRWGRNKPDWSGVHKGIRAKLSHLREGEIQSVYDMALLIMNQCSTVFFDRTKPVDERPEVLDIFSNALSHVSGMKCISFETFWRQLNKLSATDHQQADFEATARKYLNINPDGELLRETHDIIEELRMMTHIFTEQLHVVDQFKTHLQNLHEKETKKETAEDKMLDVMVEVRKLLRERYHSHEAPPANITADLGSGTTDGSTVQVIKAPKDKASPATNRNTGTTVPAAVSDAACQTAISALGLSIPESTLHLAEDVTRGIIQRRAELQKLAESTVYVSDQLKDLLGLKQQQASIIEAKYALLRADESVSQGRSIMLFTIVTIVFLPLSFMSSVFGMNAKDFSEGGNNTMSLKHMFRLLFPISLGVILVSLALAFSTTIRSLLYFIGSVTWAAVYEYTYLRWMWLSCKKVTNILLKREKRPNGHKSEGFYGARNEYVRWIYGRKERAKLRKEWDEAKEREKKKKEEKLVIGRGNSGGAVGGSGGGMVNGTAAIDGKGLPAMSGANGLPLGSVDATSASVSGSASGKKQGLRASVFRRSAGDQSEKSEKSPV